MNRGASGAFLAELAKNTNSPCWMAELYFDGGTDRVTDAWKSISWGGHTYTAGGSMLSFSGLSETIDLQIPNVTLTVSGVDQTYVSVALSTPFMDRRLVIYKAFLDYTQSVITNPVAVFDGRMDSMSISDEPGGTSTVTIAATSQWGDFDRRPGRHTNSAEQQVFFPGDKFFDYCSQLNKEIRWGAL